MKCEAIKKLSRFKDDWLQQMKDSEVLNWKFVIKIIQQIQSSIFK